MKKKWSRLLAILLAVSMVTALLPAAAAEGENLELQNPDIVEELPDVPGDGEDAAQETLPAAPDAEETDEEVPPVSEPEEGDGDEAAPPAGEPEEGDGDEAAPPAGEPEEGDGDETAPPAGEPEEEDGDEETPPAGGPEDSVLDSTAAVLETVLEIPVQMFAAGSGDYEYVLDTDGIDSGAVYAIVFSGSSEKRVLYHKDESTTSDQVTPTLSGNKMTPDSMFDVSYQLWYAVEGENGGFALQSTSGANNVYLDLTQITTSKIGVSATAHELNIVLDEETGTYQISQNVDGTLHYVRHPDSGSQFYTGTADGSDYMSFCFFKQTSVTAEPEEPDPLAIPGYTRVTSAELDPEKYHLFVTRDSDGNLYALYPAAGTVSSGGVDQMEDGLYVAALDTSGSALSAAYLKDNTGIEDMAAIQFVAAQSNNGYTFYNRASKLYLNIADGGMFSVNAVTLGLTVSDGVYTLRNSGANRVLDFNKNGDNLSGSFKEMTTNFWGPRGTQFPLYLYTLDGAIVEPEEPEVPEKPSAPADFTVYAYPKASGELEDGIYAIVGSTVEKSTARPRVMHCEESYTATNQCQVAENEHVNGIPADQISMNCGTAHLWQVTAVDGGFTFQSLTGKYLNHGSAGYNHLPVGNAPAVFGVTPLEDGGYAITWETESGVLNLGWDNKWGGSTEPYTIYLYKMTEVEPDMAETHFSGVSYGQPLVKADTGSGYFRIPALLTLDNGWILASSDIRWRTAADNPQNLDTIVSISKDGGETWEWEVVNYYADEATTTTTQASAAFIDPSFIQSSDGTVWMAVDATPSYVGLMAGNRRGYASRGFDSQGRMLVAHGTADADAPTDISPYTYYVDLNAGGTLYEVDGEAVNLYPICASADESETGYWVDAFLDLYYDYGEAGGMKPVLCAQRGSGKVVQNNLFYRQSEWKAYPAFFIMVRSAQITDSGLEWSEPRYLDIKLSEGESFLGVCPGRGILTTVDGHERIIFPLYDNQTGTELASTVYSDDGGLTWTRGARSSGLNGTGKSSESQIVRLPNGDLRMYSRNTIHYLGYADSSDGGVTWSAYTQDQALYSQNPGNGCMMSFINVDGYLISPDNTVYENLIMASYPRLQRREGTVRIGSIDAETNVVTWLNSDQTLIYNSSNNSGNFSYSCLTQLQGVEGAAFGFLYENNPSNGEITYANLTLDQVMGETGWSLLPELPELPEISLDQDLLDLDVGRSAVLTAEISLPDIEAVWTSSDEAVATVDGGNVTGVAAGRAVITATVTVGPLTRSASAEVVVQSDVITVPTKYADAVSSQFFPAVTTYELETEGLESGAVYAVFDAAGGNRILYHASGTSKTDQCYGSVSGNLLTLASYAPNTQLWTVEQTEDGGYTLCSLDDGKYLNYGTAGSHNHLPVTATPQIFTLTPLEDGSFSISWETASGTAYLDWSSWWGAGTEEYPLQFFRRVITESRTVYTAHAENLRVLIGIAGADEAEYADVLALAGPYGAEAEAQTAQAQIDAAALALYTAFRAPEPDPDPTPVYTITYQITGSYFVNASYAVQTYEEGAAVTPAAAPSYSGYTFSGWSGVPAQMPASNLIVTGSFTAVSSSGGGSSSGGTVVRPRPTPPQEEPPVPETSIEENQTPLASTPFTDVDTEAWYAEPVAFVQEKGLMQGTSSETFEPGMELSRGMMAQILFNLAGKPAAAGSASFTDVDSAAWYADAIAWAAEKDVVSGYGNTFGPNDSITREQMAVMLYNYAKSFGLNTTVDEKALQAFQDAGSISDWAREAVLWAVHTGLLTGKDAGHLDPTATATRAEVATILMRFCTGNEL